KMCASLAVTWSLLTGRVTQFGCVSLSGGSTTSPPQRLVARIVWAVGDDGRTAGLAEHADVKLGPRRRELGSDHGERQRLAGPPAKTARGRAPDRRAVLGHRLRAARVGFRDADDFQRDEPVLEPLAAPGDERVAAE